MPSPPRMQEASFSLGMSDTRILSTTTYRTWHVASQLSRGSHCPLQRFPSVWHLEMGYNPLNASHPFGVSAPSKPRGALSNETS
eukprot:jgi/Botrbrau1/21829/Bobra.0190s0044.1